MRTRVKVHVHRNYVQTLVKFIERPCSYVEFGVGSLRGPINVLNSTNLRADLETSVSHGVDDRFSEFPENAYFEMVYEYETSASVQGAASSKDVLFKYVRFANQKHGIQDLTDAFKDSVPTPIRLKVVSNVFTAIANRDAETFMKLIKAISTASGNKTIREWTLE